MNAGCASVDHGLHQFKGIQHATKARLSVRHDGQEIVNIAGVTRVETFHPLNLVGTGECVVNAVHNLGNRIGGIKGLVGVHLSGEVRITRHLPAREINSLQPSLRLLKRLIARQCAEAIDEGLVVDQVPEFLCAALGKRVFGLQRAAKTDHISRGVSALDAAPAGVF